MKEGWTYKKLGEIATDMYRGSGIKRDQVTKEGMPCVRYGEIYTTYNIGFDKCVSHTDLSQISSPKYFEHGDLLFAITGESVEDIGKTIAYLGHEKCLSGGDIVVLKHNQDPKYLSYALSAPNAIKQKGLGKTKLKVVHTNIPALKEILIPIPSLDEQQRIVSRLDSAFAHIDELKAKAEKQLSEARTLFQQALTKAMEPKEGWEEKTLGELASDMYRGSGIKRDQVTSKGMPCVRYGEIYTTYNIGFDECVSHTIESYISSPKYFEHGDLLFAITGESVEDIGKTIAYLGHEKCLLGGDIICMKHRQDPKFMAYVLSTPDAIRQKGIGKTKLKVVHTNAPALKAISIPVPPLSEQQRIVARLDSLSTHIRELEEVERKIIAECDALKQALLRKVFE